MPLKFISLNLYRGGILMDEMLDFLEHEQPDILVAQEVLNSDDPAAPQRLRSIETIQKRMHFASVEYAEAFIDNEDGHRFPSGNAIFSRFPIVEHHIIPYDVPYGERTEHNPDAWTNTPRNLQHGVVQADGVTWNVFNTQGVWDLDGDRASDRRKKMCQTIAEAVHGKANVLLAGDSNLKPTNAALQPVDELLHSVFGHELATSFNVRRKDLVKFPGYAGRGRSYVHQPRRARAKALVPECRHFRPLAARSGRGSHRANQND